MPSRGDSISAYLPPFSKGAKVYAGQMKSSYFSAIITGDGTVIAKAHGLGGVPTVVLVTPWNTGTILNAGASATIGVASVSAATATNVYLTGQAGAKGMVYVLL